MLAYASVVDISTENFMTGYHVVFDREKFVLGWKKFDCRCYSHLYMHTLMLHGLMYDLFA